MSFLATLNSFFLANEVAVVTVVAVALVLFQLALLASAFLAETATSTGSVQAVVPATGDVDGVNRVETAVAQDEFDVWAAYAYAPWGL